MIQSPICLAKYVYVTKLKIYFTVLMFLHFRSPTCSSTLASSDVPNILAHCKIVTTLASTTLAELQHLLLRVE